MQQHHADPLWCLDCGIDTRQAAEVYMVTHELWALAVPEDPRTEESWYEDYFLCIACLETRLGRRLNPEDFLDVPLNDMEDIWPKSDLLIARLAGVYT